MTALTKKIINTEKSISDALVTIADKEDLFNKELEKTLKQISSILADIYYDLRKAEYNDSSALMSNTQIAEMLSCGYGEVRDESSGMRTTSWSYPDEVAEYEIPERFTIRKWGSREFVTPTLTLYEEWLRTDD